MATDFYAVLELKRSASPDEVKKSFRTLAKKHHPDVGGNADTFKQVSQAYATLSDPAKRRRYDLTLPGVGFTPAPRAAYQGSMNVHFDFDDFMRANEDFNKSMEDLMRFYGQPPPTTRRPQNMQNNVTASGTTMHQAQYQQVKRRLVSEIYYDPVSRTFKTRMVETRL